MSLSCNHKIIGTSPAIPACIEILRRDPAKRKSAVVVSVAAAALLPGLAAAQQASHSPHSFTANVGWYSQYIFGGLTQTNGKPALQGGVNYAHASGFYLGAWGSNVSWFEDTNVGTLPGTAPGPMRLTNPTHPTVIGPFAGTGVTGFSASGNNSNDVEVDIYGGWKKSWGDWGLDVGLLKYWYPGDYNNLGGYFSKPDTLEVYGAGSWKWITLKYSHALGDAFGAKNSKGSSYIDLSANVPLGDSGFTLGLHAGHQKFKGISPVWAFGFGAGTGANNDLLTYTDYKISLSREWWDLNWTATLTTTNTKARATFGAVTGAVWENADGKDIGRSTLTLGVQKTF